MIVCPCCGTDNVDMTPGCSSCQFEPQTIDGVVCWAPELAQANDGFHADAFHELYEIEAEHFWFRARNELILWALRTHFGAAESLMEVGCGTGFVLSGISDAFPSMRLVGSEIFSAGISFAAQRVPRADLIQADARCLPFKEAFDVVASFDVIEHIEEDELVLENFYRATRPGGGCLITVPQHPWLWSPLDEQACHKRRYRASDLHEKIERAGFSVVSTTSFVTFLLPAMMLSRIAVRRAGESTGINDQRKTPIVGPAFERVLQLERMFIRAGVRWPVGGSRLVVARKEA